MKTLLKAAMACASVFAAFVGMTADITINVPEGVTQDFYTAAAANGLTKASFTGQRLVKTGLGTLVSTNDLANNESANYFTKLWVKEGVFSVRTDGDFGYNGFSSEAILVEPGASIRYDAASGNKAANRCILLSGGGATGEGGVLRCMGYGEVSFAQYKLQGDATFATSYANDYSLCFQGGGYGGNNKTIVYLNGHDLTLKTVNSGKGYRLSGAFRLEGTGRVVVDGTYFGQGGAEVANLTANDGDVTLVLRNGATFRPRFPSMVSFFDAIDAEAGTTIAAGEGGAAAFDMTIDGLAGAPTATALTSLTVGKSLTVRVADLKQGHRLAVDGSLAFGEDVTLTIEGNPNELTLDADNRIKIATSQTGVTGLPVIRSAKLLRHWSVVAGEDRTSVELAYDPALPEGVIDVRTDWGVLPGRDAADANAALFNERLAALTDANPVLYFTEGDYYFKDALVIARDGVVLTGEGTDAVLHLAEGATATSLVRLTGANDSVTGITIADTTGPGVLISGATSCAVTNAFFSGVAGTYPVEAENSTLTCVRDNRFPGGETYAALAHHTGGSVADESEPLDNKIRLTVDAGERETFAEVFAKCGIAASALAGQHVDKVGPGTLVGDTSTGAGEASKAKAPYFLGLTIAEGVFEAPSIDCFGTVTWMASDHTHVLKGATLRITAASNRGISNRNYHLAGSGAPGQGGALVWTGAATAFYPQYNIEDDAVIATEYAGGLAKAFCTDNPANPCALYLKGHDLRLVSVGGGKGFVLDKVMTFSGNNGSITVDGTTFKQTEKTMTTSSAAGSATLRLRNGATFGGSVGAAYSFFKAVDCDVTSSVIGTGDAAFALAFDAWTGAGTVDAGISSLTLSALAVRAADLNADEPLTVAGGLAFAANSTLTVDDGTALVAGDDGRVTFAASATAMSGLPTLIGGKKVRNWTVEAGADGKSGKLLYVSSKPEGAIDVAAEWGILKGSENAAGNAAKFNGGVAALSAPALLFFPMGDFYFDAPLVIAKDGVTLVGDACDSVLKAGEGFEADSLLTVSGANVTVSGLTLGNVTGPAIVANGTSAFVATNNDFVAVGGAIEGVEGAYPVEVVNGAGTLVRDNLILDGAKYAEAVYLDGGTKHADGEPLTGLVRIRVDAGEELGLEDAFARTGRAEYPTNARLVKTGGGKILSSTAYGSAIKGITVEAGVYALTGAHTGQAKYGDGDQIYVLSGATLLLAGDVDYLNNKIAFVEGTGAPGMGGAVVNEGRGICRFAQFRLTGDATFATAYAGGYAQCFNRLASDMVHPSNFSLNGHVLTLTATGSGKGYQLTDQYQFNDATGTVVVDGTTLAQGSATVVPYQSKTAKLVLRNGAKFLPRSQDILGLFSSIAADETSSVIGGDGGAAAFALTIGGWSGAGTVGTGFTSLTVTNSLAFAAADILAGKAMAAACPVTVASGVKMFLSDPEGLFAALPRVSERYVCAESAVSFTGLPRKDGTSDFRSWKPALADGTKLCIDTYLGTLLLVR